ncbi:unnamed protein product [Fraxinus pennsylvanica]|uniref:EGF-like domain-containing protein n=1 Tax=Fraxinus pennsylvanica TaxID=56036 RepID=A0AAD1Z769_9LAMI|nr:unnamed protein product [Fraxinus pennsylvanica]
MAMGLHFLKTQFILAILLSFVSISISSSIPIAMPNCMDRCGNVNIPFPFGTTEGCYHNSTFLVTCNETYNPPKAFVQNSNIEITNISLEGQLHLLNYIAKDCYQNGTRILYVTSRIELIWGLTINNTANKLTVVGCDTNAFVHGTRFNNKFYRTGCNSYCGSKGDLADGMCSGLGCCQTSIPREVQIANLTLQSYDQFKNVGDFNNCSYSFLAEESAFNFTLSSLSSLRNVTSLPMVVDWAVGDGTCVEARNNMSSYACQSSNSKCNEPNNGYGYRCYCEEGYQGNPYLVDGCQDIDECLDPNNKCEKGCENSSGNYSCICPKGYHGDGLKDGRGCIRGESLVFKLVAGIALGFIVLLLGACLRLSRKHYSVQTQPKAEEMESLLFWPTNALANGEGNTIGTGYDSTRDHILLPMGGGR